MNGKQLHQLKFRHFAPPTEIKDVFVPGRSLVEIHQQNFLNSAQSKVTFSAAGEQVASFPCHLRAAQHVLLIVNDRQTLLGLTELGRYCDHHHAGQPRQKISDPSLTLFVKVISFSWNSSVLAWLVLEGGY